MGFSRHTQTWLTRLMLGVLLFAQGAVAANACVTETGAIHAYTMSAVVNDEMIMDGVSGRCHEEDTGVGNANACLAQNTQGDQVGGDQAALHPALLPPVVLTLPVASEAAQLPARAVLAQFTPPDTGPPLPIRYCSFLN
jgi:hypothetical protein